MDGGGRRARPPVEPPAALSLARPTVSLPIHAT